MICSQEATKSRVRIGMKLAEAQAVCAQLIWRQYDRELYLHAQKKLLTELLSISPRVSATQIGMFLLDAGGRKHLGGESRMCSSILRFISTKGYTDGNIGIADSAFAASVAARDRSGRWRIVSGGDKLFLSQCSIEHLPIGQELKETLLSLAINSMGKFLELAPEEVQQRFGADGVAAYKLASGIDSRQPMLPKIEKHYQTSMEMNGPIESFTDTLFIMKSMLGRLTTALKNEAMRVEEITVRFYSDDELIEERPVQLIRPSNDSKFLLEILRLSLERKKLAREFTGISLIV